MSKQQRDANDAALRAEPFNLSSRPHPEPASGPPDRNGTIHGMPTADGLPPAVRTGRAGRRPSLSGAPGTPPPVSLSASSATRWGLATAFRPT